MANQKIIIQQDATKSGSAFVKLIEKWHNSDLIKNVWKSELTQEGQDEWREIMKIKNEGSKVDRLSVFKKFKQSRSQGFKTPAGKRFFEALGKFDQKLRYKKSFNQAMIELIRMYIPKIAASTSSTFFTKLLWVIRHLVVRINTRTKTFESLRDAIRLHKSAKIRANEKLVRMERVAKIARENAGDRNLAFKLKNQLTVPFTELFRVMRETLAPSDYLYDMISAVQLGCGCRFTEVLTTTQFNELDDSQWEALNKQSGGGIGAYITKTKNTTPREKTIHISFPSKVRDTRAIQDKVNDRSVPTWFLTSSQIAERVRHIRVILAQKEQNGRGQWNWSLDYIKKGGELTAEQEKLMDLRRTVKRKNTQRIETIRELRSRLTKMYNVQMNKNLKKKIIDRHKIGSHILRGIYANVMYDQYGSTEAQSSFISRILGHIGKKMTASAYYTHIRIKYGTKAKEENLNTRLSHIESLLMSKKDQREEQLFDGVSSGIRFHGSDHVFKKRRRIIGSDGDARVEAAIKELTKAGVNPTWRNLKRLGLGSASIANVKKKHKQT